MIVKNALLAALAVSAACAGVASQAQEATIRIDPSILRQINGVGELNRQALFPLADPGQGFEQRIQSRDRIQYLLGDLQATFGRQLGPVARFTVWGNGVQEDPDRPGFTDLAVLRKAAGTPKQASAFLKQLTGTHMDVAAHGVHNAFPEFMGRNSTELSGKAHHPQTIPENIEAAAELAAEVFAISFTDFDRPRYYEPVNEPHWSFLLEDHIAEWHLATQKAIKARTPEVKVGGPCNSVAYFYRDQFNAFNGVKRFMEMTRGELDFYSFHVYDYFEWDGEKFTGRVTSGLPLEGVFDFVQNHAANAMGKEVPIVISEHGGYITGHAGPSGETLMEQLAGTRMREVKSFEDEIYNRGLTSYVLVSTAINNTLTFMDHPHVIEKAVPFLLPETMGWDPTYYSALYVPRDYKDKNDWMETRNTDFYKFFRGLKGHRIVAMSDDPDLMTRAFIADDAVRVLISNLADREQIAQIQMPRGKRVVIRRYGRKADLTPYLTEETLESLDRLVLAPLETVMLIAEPSSVRASKVVNEKPFYGDKIRVALAGGKPGSFRVSLPAAANLAYATLRISVTRAPEADPNLEVLVNGKKVLVPLEDAADRLTAAGKEYASTKIIPLDVSLLKENNRVLVRFPDNDPGTIGSVVIRAGVKQ